MFDNYVVGAAMTFRRELDKAGKENMQTLLHEIEARPEVLSRARYRTLWGPNRYEHWGPDAAFDELPIVKIDADSAHDHLDPEAVRADRLTLEEATESVRVYVERTYAHRARGEPGTVTFTQFDAAIDAVAEVFKKYYTIITLKALIDTEPVPQYDTHECFTFPWIDERC
jgi:hypothetical protein